MDGTSLAEFERPEVPRPPPGSLWAACLEHYEVLTGLSAAVEGGWRKGRGGAFALRELMRRTGGVYAASRPAADYLEAWARLEALWQESRKRP